MKKLIIALSLLVLLSCNKEGDIVNQSQRHIIINGKEYRFIRIIPADGASAVWILVPKDSTIEIPRVISTKVSCGKNCTKEQTAILIER